MVNKENNWYEKYKVSYRATPTWEDLEKLGPRKNRKDEDEIDHFVKELRRRDKYTKNIAWAVPDEETIKKIKAFVGGKTVLEVGAGRGLWAKILQKYGIHTRPVDNFSGYGNKEVDQNEENLYTKVENVSGEKVTQQRSSDVLLMIWPPFDNDLAFNVLNNFSGNKFIYIGEREGGANANGNFFDLLSEKWNQLTELDIKQWAGIGDSIFFYTRKN